MTCSENVSFRMGFETPHISSIGTSTYGPWRRSYTSNKTERILHLLEKPEMPRAAFFVSVDNNRSPPMTVPIRFNSPILAPSRRARCNAVISA